MLCELCNKIIKFIDGDVFGRRGDYCATEVSLTSVIFIIIYGILITLIVAWWFIPIKKIMNYADNVTFKCNNNKIKEK